MWTSCKDGSLCFFPFCAVTSVFCSDVCIRMETHVRRFRGAFFFSFLF